MIRRRDFIAGLGSAVAWPLAARVQQGGRVRRIGVLMPLDENDPEVKLRLSALTQALADLSWTDGRNVRLDIRWGGEDVNRMRALAQVLVGLQPDIILTNGTQHVAEPVASGIVARLDRPGGNVTGFAILESSLGGKWLELLSEIAPGLKRAAIMFNPDLPAASSYLPAIEAAAQSLKIVPIRAPVHSDIEIETAIIALGREPRGGLVVMPDGGFMVAHLAPVISAAARNNVPAVHWLPDFAREGGLLSYGPDGVDTIRRSATYVDRILRGAKPGDLPVQFPTQHAIGRDFRDVLPWDEWPVVARAQQPAIPDVSDSG